MTAAPASATSIATSKSVKRNLFQVDVTETPRAALNKSRIELDKKWLGTGWLFWTSENKKASKC
jgi:hypothetical protein